MTDRTRRKSKLIKWILIVPMLILGLAVLTLSLLWNRYANKTSLLGKFETPQQQELYLLGTLHKNHFNSRLDYSMEDILSLVENLQPGTKVLVVCGVGRFFVLKPGPRRVCFSVFRQ